MLLWVRFIIQVHRDSHWWLFIVALSLRWEQAGALPVVFAQWHHTEITVDVKNKRQESDEGLDVEVAVIGFDAEVECKECKVEPFGVDPVSQILDMVLKEIQHCFTT